MNNAATWLVFFVLPLLIELPNALAGRPLVVDDAATVSPGHLELELGIYQGRPKGGGRDFRFPVTTLACGLFDGLELGLSIQRVNQDAPGTPPIKGFEDLHVNTKYKFLDDAGAWPALAFSLDIKIPTANRSKGLSTGKADETMLFIASKSFAALTIHANLGYSTVGNVTGAKLRDRLRGGGAMEWALGRQWSIVGEFTGSSRAKIDGKNEADFQFGTRYALRPNLVLDMAGGRSLHSSATSIQATFGLTWTFDGIKLLKR